MLDFAVVAVADGVGIKRSVGAVGGPSVAEFFRGENGDEGQTTGEFVEEVAIFGPRIEPVEDDALLTGGDEVFGFGDGLLCDPIFAFGLANHLAKSFFVLTVRGALDAAFGHLAIDHISEMDFGEALVGEIIYSDRFATAAHADDGENFEVFLGCHGIYYI